MQSLPSLRRRGLVGAAMLLPLYSRAQPAPYPQRAVRLVVPFPAGGGTDVLARFVGSRLSDAWGQPVIVENRPGATGAIATDFVAKAPGDGYTLLVATSTTHTVLPAVARSVPFDNVRDFAPVTMLTEAPSGVLVHPSLPATSMPELLALLRANPGKYNYSSSGNGGAPHLNGELFRMLSGVDIGHIPYKGDAPALNDLVAGHVQLNFGAISSALAHVQSGKLRLLAVGSAQRLPAMPNVPALREFLPGFEASSFVGLVAPAGTPPAVIARVNEAAVRAMHTEEGQRVAARLGMVIVANAPPDFASFIRSDTQRWREVARKGKIQVE